MTVGPDDSAYFVGLGLGSGWMFARDPLNLEAEAPHAAFDKYSRINSLAPSVPVSYVARISASTGAVEASQFVVARHSATGLGNSARIDAIDVDDDGTVSLAGRAACCIAGLAAETYRGGDTFVMVVPGTLDRRIGWTSLSERGAGDVVDLAARGGITAVVANNRKKAPSRFVVRNALQRTAGGGLDAFLSILRTW